MFDEPIDFIPGERKIITVRVEPIDPNETVIVNKAWYELMPCGSESVLERGDCETSGDKAELLLGIDEKGSYTLKVTAEVGREVIKKKVSVRVR